MKKDMKNLKKRLPRKKIRESYNNIFNVWSDTLQSTNKILYDRQYSAIQCEKKKNSLYYVYSHKNIAQVMDMLGRGLNN